MSGRHPWSEIAKKFSPEQRREIDAIKNELTAELPLHELELRPARAATHPSHRRSKLDLESRSPSCHV